MASCKQVTTLKQIKILVLVPVFVFFFYSFTIAGTNATIELDFLKDDLYQNPELWATDAFRICRMETKEEAEKWNGRAWACKVSIWIANGSYGIEIDHPYNFKPPQKVREEIWDSYMAWRDIYRVRYFKEEFEQGLKTKEENLEQKQQLKELKTEKSKSNKVKILAQNTKQVVDRKGVNDHLVPLIISFLAGCCLGCGTFGLILSMRKE